MRIYENLTPATHYILTNWAAKGYRCWITTGPLPRDKAERILLTKWPEAYDTGLSASKRQRRKLKKIPNAIAMAAPVVGMPGHLELIMMATEHALTAPPGSAFAKERWLTKCPEISDYVLVHEPRHTGQYAWTWRLKPSTIAEIEHYLVMLIAKGDAAGVRRETTQWAKFYCMHGGVRRQLRRLLHAGRKHWTRKYETTWPGFNPEDLPVNIGFKGERAKNAARKVSSEDASGHASNSADQVLDLEGKR
jgi:hypothetical protein